jgi:hypothetical protein
MKRPRIRKVSDPVGSTEALVYVKGWLSGRDDKEESRERWVQCLRAGGFRGSVYHLWWDSSSRKNLAKAVAKGVALGAVLVGVGVVLERLRKARSRAKKIGRKYAPGMIHKEVKETPISLLGVSLGARVVVQTVLSSEPGTFRDVILLGGAVRRDKIEVWKELADRVSGKVVNVYNPKDKVLRLVAKTLKRGQSPCGLRPVRYVDKAKMVNVAHEWSDDHKDYKRQLARTVGPELWSG